MPKKNPVLKIFGYCCLFLLFVFAANEDRLFKQWKSYSVSVYSSYFALKRYMSRNLPPGTKVLVDVSELRRIDDPFQNKITGGLRRQIYQLSTLERRILRLRGLIPDQDIQAERLGRTRKWKPYRGIPEEQLMDIPLDGYEELNRFMRDNDLSYYVCHFDYWRRKKRVIEFMGFDLVFNNYRYMLFALEEER